MASDPLYKTYNTTRSHVQQMFYACAGSSAPVNHWNLPSRNQHAPACERFSESLIEHEVETAGERSLVLGCAHQQLAAKEAVGAVLRLAGEIELSGQHAAAARLHLHMNMARAANIGAGHDAAQSIAPFRIGELMAAQTEARIVVPAFIVGLPELQQRSSERFTGAGEYEANQFDGLPGHTCFKQFAPFGRGRLEERPFGLPQCCCVAVVARGRR